MGDAVGANTGNWVGLKPGDGVGFPGEMEGKAVPDVRVTLLSLTTGGRTHKAKRDRSNPGRARDKIKGSSGGGKGGAAWDSAYARLLLC
jgi:hypothetical protein